MASASTPLDLELPIGGAASGGVLRDALRNTLRQRNAIVGLIILGALLVLAVLADQIARWPPDQVLLGIEPGVVKSSSPCVHVLGCAPDQPEHFMGVDSNVRDEFSR